MSNKKTAQVFENLRCLYLVILFSLFQDGLHLLGSLVVGFLPVGIEREWGVSLLVVHIDVSSFLVIVPAVPGPLAHLLQGHLHQGAHESPQAVAGHAAPLLEIHDGEKLKIKKLRN